MTDSKENSETKSADKSNKSTGGGNFPSQCSRSVNYGCNYSKFQETQKIARKRASGDDISFSVDDFCHATISDCVNNGVYTCYYFKPASIYGEYMPLSMHTRSLLRYAEFKKIENSAYTYQ